MFGPDMCRVGDCGLDLDVWNILARNIA
jgi:hypothetical protein